MKQRADYWMERGAADAVLRLALLGKFRPLVSYVDACKAAGISARAAKDALARHKASQRPARRSPSRAPHPAAPGFKWCGKGGHFVPHAEFSPNATSTTGLQSYCKACHTLDARERRAQRKTDRTCKTCGVAFTPGETGRIKYCSQGCYEATRRASQRSEWQERKAS